MKVEDLKKYCIFSCYIVGEKGCVGGDGCY